MIASTSIQIITYLGMSPMDVFRLRDAVIQDYAEYVRSFVQIRDRRIDNFVEFEL